LHESREDGDWTNNPKWKVYSKGTGVTAQIQSDVAFDGRYALKIDSKWSGGKDWFLLIYELPDD